MKVVQINAEHRSDFGKKAAKMYRKEGKIPAQIYSVNGVDSFTTTHQEVKAIVYTSEFKLAEINIGGTAKKAILKDIDFHPVTDQIVHIDFLELVEGQKIKAEIPVSFKGVSPGVKNGGKLMRNLNKIKVKTTPDHLVEELFIDISELELGQATRVRDIDLPEGIEIILDGATPVAVVEVPRALKSAAGDDSQDVKEQVEPEAQAAEE